MEGGGFLFESGWILGYDEIKSKTDKRKQERKKKDPGSFKTSEHNDDELYGRQCSSDSEDQL